jgi:hypothetical protein
MDVDVRRFHDPQMRLIGLCAGGERMQHDKRRRGGGTGKNGPARDL